MNKMYVLMKCTYSDFDIAIGEPIAVSPNKQVLNSKMEEINAELTEDSNVYYKIYDKQVKVL